MDTELQIETAILKYLNGLPEVFAIKFSQASYSRKNTFRPAANGVADLIVNLNYRQMMWTCYMEVKKAKGQLRDTQKAFQVKIWGLKGKYFVVRSVEDVKESLGKLRDMADAYIDKIEEGYKF